MNREGRLTLDLLRLIQTDAHVTQRKLANELGIALGLANSYLKRCIHKGYVKVAAIPTNRYAYYLTPTGLAEKSALVAKYLTHSFQFFRDAKNQSAQLFRVCQDRGWRRLMMCGDSDLAEIARLIARDFQVDIIGTLEFHHPAPTAAATAARAELARLAPVDAVILADLTHPQAIYDGLLDVLPDERILALPMLDIHRRNPASSADS